MYTIRKIEVGAHSKITFRVNQLKEILFVGLLYYHLSIIIEIKYIIHQLTYGSYSKL